MKKKAQLVKITIFKVSTLYRGKKKTTNRVGKLLQTYKSQRINTQI